MSRTNNLLPGIVECVLCCTTVEMVNGSSKGKDRKNVTKCKKTKQMWQYTKRQNTKMT